MEEVICQTTLSQQTCNPVALTAFQAARGKVETWWRVGEGIKIEWQESLKCESVGVCRNSLVNTISVGREKNKDEELYQFVPRFAAYNFPLMLNIDIKWAHCKLKNQKNDKK